MRIYGTRETERQIDKILRLVEELSPEAEDELNEEMKLRWLRRAVKQADESLAQGKVFSQEELDRRLDAIHSEIIDGQKVLDF